MREASPPGAPAHDPRGTGNPLPLPRRRSRPILRSIQIKYFKAIAESGRIELTPLTVFVTPLFPASGPATGSFNGLNPKSIFLAFTFLPRKRFV